LVENKILLFLELLKNCMTSRGYFSYNTPYYYITVLLIPTASMLKST